MDAKKLHCIPKPPTPPIFNPTLKHKIEFAMKDKDGSGDVSIMEHLAGANKKEYAQRYAEFKRYDTNGDGKLSEEEFIRGRQLDQFRDGFGAISKDEFIRGKVTKEAFKGLQKKEEPSIWEKLLKGLTFTNPITAPFAAANWLREKIAG